MGELGQSNAASAHTPPSLPLLPPDDAPALPFFTMKSCRLAFVALLAVLAAHVVCAEPRTKIEAPLGRAKVPLRNYVPLVGEEIYGKQQFVPSSGAATGTASNEGENRCCTKTCQCNGQASCCAKKVANVVAKVVKRGELPNLLVDNSPRDTQVVKSLMSEKTAEEPKQFSKSPLYPRTEESKVTITKSTLPETDRSSSKHVAECDCCFKATVPAPITPCNCCGGQQ